MTSIHRGASAFFLIAATVLLSACGSSAPVTKNKEPEKPPEPIGGRRAFQQTFITARTWAQDLQLLGIRSVPLPDTPTEPGKAAVWEVTFVSPSRRAARSYVYSVMKLDGIFQGVVANPEVSYSGPRGQVSAFNPLALKVDTPDAWETAVEKSKDYMAKNPDMPITYVLEKTTRFPNPAWRVIWGTSPATSGHSIYVDASTGGFLERSR